ncbi:conserved hypothetical protein [Ignisphaera aggregans DSM 17230]|uniref:Flagellar biosynthesis protein FlaG n=1 Tax=Ignisphaera aggregans (strain DSM 17230 / JCM 13409 / AQ1.S1) TaxID=583356 RepID=E0SRS8_IGNAA|nr:conserved hypothetical protein [Ignisphaera aggregans DSM 17230]
MYLKRAISPIVATILLILISIAAGVILWLWISGFIAQTPTAQPALAERIRIEAVKVNTTHITIYVRNLGNLDVTISSAYILDIGGVVMDFLNISKTTIPPGEVRPVSAQVDTSSPYRSGYSYMVKVVTSSGVEAQYVFVWP